MHSESIAKLTAALVAAQSEMGAAVRDSENTFHHTKYADLSAVIDACRPALVKHGLAVIQMPTSDADGRIGLVTTLSHVSGEHITETIFVQPAKPNDPQVAGSIITYMRRYALAATVGVPQTDDDGQAAAKAAAEPVKAKPEDLPPKTKEAIKTVAPLKSAAVLTLTDKQVERMKALMKQHGVSARQVKALVDQTYTTPIKSAADIKQIDYDDLCAWIISGAGK